MSVTRRRTVVVVALVISLWACRGWAQALRVVGFNVESAGVCSDGVNDLIQAA
jgi:hypothetical protein